tara:strand:+ start:37 stop:393 length:357 start_codon:yes stop_codon:yes gene_type:complete
MIDYLINLKLVTKERIIVNIALLVIFQYEFQIISAMESKSNLPELVHHCFISKKKDDCRELLLQLEVLQLQELTRENYPCQTRLLGLQSHVIMIMQELTKRVSYQEILNEVKEYCYNF